MLPSFSDLEPSANLPKVGAIYWSANLPIDIVPVSQTEAADMLVSNVS